MERFPEKLLGKKVDLVRKGGIRPELKKIILKEVVYICPGNGDFSCKIPVTQYGT